jgi:hypothetical protein
VTGQTQKTDDPNDPDAQGWNRAKSSTGAPHDRQRRGGEDQDAARRLIEKAVEDQPCDENQNRKGRPARHTCDADDCANTEKGRILRRGREGPKGADGIPHVQGRIAVRIHPGLIPARQPTELLEESIDHSAHRQRSDEDKQSPEYSVVDQGSPDPKGQHWYQEQEPPADPNQWASLQWIEPFHDCKNGEH